MSAKRSTLNNIQFQTTELDERAWNTWVEKGKRRDQAQSRRLKVAAGVVMLSSMIFTALYATLLQH